VASVLEIPEELLGNCLGLNVIESAKHSGEPLELTFAALAIRTLVDEDVVMLIPRREATATTSFLLMVRRKDLTSRELTGLVPTT